MISVNSQDGRIAAWGKQTDVKEIYWYTPPHNFPEVGEPLDLSGSNIKAIFEDGTEEFVTQYCTFSPAEGTTVGLYADDVTITAFYVAKSGKVLSAPITLPTVVPSELRIIIPNEPLIDEGIYPQAGTSWNDYTYNGTVYRGYKSAFLLDDVRICIYWRAGDNRLVRITDAENVRIHSAGFVSGGPGWGGNYLKCGHRTATKTTTRYSSISHEGEEIEVENAALLSVKTTVRGRTLYASTYIQTNPITVWGPINLPGSYSGTKQFNYTIKENSAVRFKNGKRIEGYPSDWDGTAPYPRYWLNPLFRYKVVGGWYEYTDSGSVTLRDGASGNMMEYCIDTYVDSNPTWKVRTKSYSCSGGTVTWTDAT